MSNHLSRFRDFLRHFNCFNASSVLLVMLLCSGCEDSKTESHPNLDSSQLGGELISELPENPVIRQTVYVPVYSHIYHRDGTYDFSLTTTLSVRNTDQTHSIVVAEVQYYDSTGKLVRKYLEKPLKLPPLSSRPFIVADIDKSGGVGANFIVEWQAEEKVNPPIIEAVMISTASTQGISFITRGQVLQTDSTIP